MKKKESSLKNLHEHLRSILNTSWEIIFTKNIEGHYTYVNAAFSKIFKKPLKEIIGKTDKEIFPEEEARKRREIDLKIQENGKPDTREDILTIKGKRRIFKTTRVPLRNKEGKIIGVCGFAEDITEHKKAEEKLHESEEKYKFLVDHTKEVILILSKQGKILFANREALNSFGYSEEEVIGKSITNFLTKNSFKKAFYSLAQEFLGHHQPEMEIQVKAKSGEFRHLKLTEGSSPIYDKGKLTGVMVTAYDITEKERMQQEIEERKSYLERVLRSVPDAIVTLDTQGKVMEWNPEAERLFGYKTKEAVGRNLDDLIAGTNPEKHREASNFTRSLLEGKNMEVIDTIRHRKDGSPVNVILTASPILRKNKTIGLVAVYTDITGFKKAREALRESEEKYRTLAETTRDIILMMDLDENVTYINQEGLNLCGYKKEELIGKPARNCIPSEYINEIEIHHELGKKEKGFLYDIEFVTRTKQRIPMEISSSSVKRNGKTIGILITARNITERKKTEEKLRWELMVKKAVAEVSNSLINPLSSIEEVANMVLDYAKLLTESKDGYVSVIDPETGDNIWYAYTNMFETNIHTGKRRPIIFSRGLNGRYPALWGHALNTKKAFYTNSPETHEASKGLPSGHLALRNFLSAPILIGEEPVGQIALANSEKNYTERDIEAIEELTKLYGIAIHRKRTDEALKRNEQRLHILREIDHAILEARSSQEIARATLSYIEKLIPCARASVIVFDFEKDKIFILAAIGKAPALENGVSFPIKDSHYAEHLKRNKIKIVEDISSIKKPFKVAKKLAKEGIVSYATIPIIFQEELLGALNLGYSSPHHFRKEELEMTREIANSLGTALSQAQLHESLQRYAEELEQRVAQRTAKLQEINKELETFAFTVSHDLRAPLRAMEGFANALLEDYADKLNKEGREYAHRIMKASESMEELIQDLLSYSRLTRMEISLKSVDLGDVVDRAIDQLEEEIREKKARIDIIRPLPKVMGHSGVILQVIFNLLSNAIKFVEKGVQPHIVVWSEEKGNLARLYVKDNGIGIAPKHQKRIFEVFERLHGQDIYPGTGIGLAIVRKGIERLGGSVGLESRLRKGSIFYIEIKRAKEGEKSHGRLQ